MNLGDWLLEWGRRYERMGFVIELFLFIIIFGFLISIPLVVSFKVLLGFVIYVTCVWLSCDKEVSYA